MENISKSDSRKVDFTTSMAFIFFVSRWFTKLFASKESIIFLNLGHKCGGVIIQEAIY